MLAALSEYKTQHGPLPTQKGVGPKGEPVGEWLLSQRHAAKNGVLMTGYSADEDTGFDEYLFRRDAPTVFEQRRPQHAGTAGCSA
jgi:hypothetical protein